MSAGLMSDIYMFVLAILAGYEVITKVPSTLHTPLMSASNAIHGIVIIGAIVTASQARTTAGYVLAFVAAFFAAMNVVGGYSLTDRMLQMFRKRPTGMFFSDAKAGLAEIIAAVKALVPS